MGSGSSKKVPPIVTQCSSPVYCVRRIGNRHLLLAGGGGAAKTGVTNQIEAFLLTLEQRGQSPGPGTLRASLAGQIKTDPYATMNMDVVAVEEADCGRYLIACGQDQFCEIYETTGWVTTPGADEKQLTFNFNPVGKFTTDHATEMPYQKCCSFDRSKHGAQLATGGADGHIRVWSVRDLCEHRDPTLTRKPILEIAAHRSEVGGVEFSPDGRYIISVGDNTAIIWETQNGKRVAQLPLPPALQQGYKVRSAHFTPLGDRNIVFVVSFNQIARSSKSVSYLGVYVLTRESGNIRLVVLKDIVKGDAISTVSLSPSGGMVGVGTMDGSVLVLDTHDLRLLHSAPNTHGIFVTGIEFLDNVAVDTKLPQNLPLAGALPGPASPYLASVVSLSADQTLQVHDIALSPGTPLSQQIFYLSLVSLLLYLFVWFFTSIS